MLVLFSDCAASLSHCSFCFLCGVVMIVIFIVIAEIVASTTGIGAMMMRARRFLHTDEIMAGIMVIGILGLLFDILFRLIHRKMFSYLY